MDQDNEAKLDALVGAALRGLVEAGASASAIGAFAASYRKEAAQVLGLTPQPAEAPDLLQLVTAAVSMALQETPARRRRTGPAKPRATKFHVLIAGLRTTITLRADLTEKLLAAKGKTQAQQFVAQLAENIPPDAPNRSAWVTERVAAALAYPQDATSAARH